MANSSDGGDGGGPENNDGDGGGQNNGGDGGGQNNGGDGGGQNNGGDGGGQNNGGDGDGPENNGQNDQDVEVDLVPEEGLHEDHVEVHEPTGFIDDFGTIRKEEVDEPLEDVHDVQAPITHFEIRIGTQNGASKKRTWLGPLLGFGGILIGALIGVSGMYYTANKPAKAKSCVPNEMVYRPKLCWCERGGLGYLRCEKNGDGSASWSDCLCKSRQPTTPDAGLAPSRNLTPKPSGFDAAPSDAAP